MKNIIDESSIYEILNGNSIQNDFNAQVDIDSTESQRILLSTVLLKINSYLNFQILDRFQMKVVNVIFIYEIIKKSLVYGFSNN